MGVLQGWSQETKYLAVTPAEMLNMAFTLRSGSSGVKSSWWQLWRTPMGRVQMTCLAVNTTSPMMSSDVHLT